jgi:hypothetical protein
VTFSPEQRVAIELYLSPACEISGSASNTSRRPFPGSEPWSATRTDDFVDVQTGRPGHVSVRLTKTLRRVDGRWLFASSR